MILVQKAKAEDMKCIRDMAEIVFRHTYCDILSAEQIDYMMDWMYSPASLRRQLDEGHIYYIAFRDCVPCGYASVQQEGVCDDGRHRFHLQKIYVLPSEQGTGVGRMLLDTVLGHVRTSVRADAETRIADSETDHQVGAVIELNVNRNNPAINFYSRFGFKILRQGDFHIGNGFYMNDYIMGLEL